MNKVLVTSGCSFTESIYAAEDNYQTTKTWAYYLGRYLKLNHDYDFINKGLGSQGNGLIGRGALYQVTEELKTRNPEDILVGVMWSGADRHDYRCENPELTEFKINNVDNGWMENPTRFIPSANKHWIIMNHHWGGPDSKGRNNKEAELYYKYFHDTIGSYIYTLEHMLRLQYFLKNFNIKYFFTIYQDHVLDPQYMNHPEVKYLYKLLDKEHFLPVMSEYTWCVESRIDEGHWIYPHPANHPSSLHHKGFTDQVILPWLQSKNYI